MYDVVIIGAGVIGCSIARELSRYKLDVVVLEKENDVACKTSKANSGIVHAGFDAVPGTLKAKLNAKSNEMFDELSKELDFPFKRNGSLVLCFDAEGEEVLKDLLKQGIENGVPGIELISKEQVLALEPNISEEVYKALYAPTGGIVCPYELTLSMAENAYDNGVNFSFQKEVKSIVKENDKFKIGIGEEFIFGKTIINCAGVYSDEINNLISKEEIHIIPRKGEYMLFDKIAGTMVRSTIFQTPTKMGKGILVTPTVDGNLLIGPNAKDIDDKEDYNTTELGLNDIKTKAQKSIKDLPFNAVITSFSGLRAHEVNDDFIIGESKDVEGLFNVCGIESPGLSCAPYIGVMVSKMVADKFGANLKEEFKNTRTGLKKFREMDNDERNLIIKENPSYGKIVCRCEVVTEGEIIDSIRRPLGAKDLDGVKRRTRAGMGRCQSGFCSPKILSILAKELSIPLEEVTKKGGNSTILVGRNKEDI